MCHDDDSRPPSPPVVGEVAEQGLVTLTATDDNQLAAYRAVPAEPNGANVLILPDVRGLHPYYEALTVRFAEAGFNTVAIDYFGRSLGVGTRDDSLDAMAEIGKLKPEYLLADSDAGVTFLQQESEGPVFSVGFCYGGSVSWGLGASDLGLAGCIGFYGRPSRIADVEADIDVPLLMLVAGADRATPTSEFEALAARLDAAGKEYEMHVYEGAPHSFFDRSFAEWEDACADAWVRIIDFTRART